MVRDMYQREYNRAPQWADTRFTMEPGYGEDPRYHDAPVTIGAALRERCRIPAEKYFVAVILDSGKLVCYGGPDEWHKSEMTSFFDARQFELAAKRHYPSGGTSMPLDDADQGFDDGYRPGEYITRSRPFSRRAGPYQMNQFASSFGPSSHGYGDDDSIGSGQLKARKRARNHFHREGDAEEEAPASKPHKEILAGDSKQIWDFCDTRFKNLQQTACKLVAKAWIKLVEPKKQSTHPYTGSDEKAPGWWPKPWGPTKDEKVRHKEPDHLYKKERVYLLNHILSIIVEPTHKQHPDIQKLKLNVAKLEEATNEALSAFFMDKDNLGNAKKKPYLKEIFKVARAQERFKNGEVDDNYTVWVMADDKFPDDWQSGDEHAAGSVKQEEAQRQTDRTAGPSSHASPQRTAVVTHGLMPAHGLPQTPAASDRSPTGVPPIQTQHTSGGLPFINEIPVRGQQPLPPPPHQHQQQHPQQQQPLPPAPIMTSTDLGPPPEVHQYVDTTPIHHAPSSQSLQDMYSTAPEHSRRPSSLFQSPTEYPSVTSAGSGAAMYQQWSQPQHVPGPQTPNSAPSSTVMYTFAPQQAAPPPLPPQQQQQPPPQQPQQQAPQHPHQHQHPHPHAHQHQHQHQHHDQHQHQHQHQHQQQQQQQAPPPPPPQMQASYVTPGGPVQVSQVPPHAQQSYLGPAYVVDGIPRDAYDPQSQSMYRTGPMNLPPSDVSSAPSYPNYMSPHDTGNITGGPRT